MFETLLFLISFIGLSIASFTDLRERIVPDWVSYSMIVLGLALHALAGFLLQDFGVVFPSIVSTLIAFVFSLVLWKAGFWAGGDVKIFTGIGALNPVNFGQIKSFLGLNDGFLDFGILTGFPFFSLELFVFSVIMVFPFGLLLVLKNLNADKELRNKTANGLFNGLKKSVFFSLALIALVSFLPKELGFFESFFLTIALAGVIGFFSSFKFFEIASIAVFLLSVFFNWFSEDFFVFFGFFFGSAFLLFFLFRLVHLSQNGVLLKKVSVEKLSEGMISGVTLVEVNGKIREWKPSMKNILKNLNANSLESVKNFFIPEGKVIVSGAQADGLSMEQIKELQALAGKKLIDSHLKVKESTAFVPAIFLAYILLQATGDILWSFLL